MPQSLEDKVEHYHQNYVVLNAQQRVHEVSLVYKSLNIQSNLIYFWNVEGLIY